MNQIKPRICAVVLANTLTDFLQQLTIAQSVADYVELRVDYLTHLQLNDLKEIRKKISKPAILCCRAIKEGGQFKGTLAEQNKLLQYANDLEFDFLDIDIDIAAQIQLNNPKSKIIISYHNFQQTPPLSELENTAESMRGYHPFILKFAVMVNHPRDANILFQFLLRKKNHEEMIVVGMGEQGKLLRLLGPLLGSYLTFATINSAQSASGQMSIQQMQTTYQHILELTKA